MKHILAYLASLVPLLASAQSYHQLFEFEPWDYVSSESEISSWAYNKNRGLGLLLTVSDEDATTQTVVLTDKNGDVTESYRFDGLDNHQAELEYQGNFVYFNYRSAATISLTLQSWRHFRYRISNGLVRRLDQTAVLNGRLLNELRLNDAGFRFISYDYNLENPQITGVQTTVGVWSYSVANDPFDNIAMVKMSDAAELAWAFNNETFQATLLDRNGVVQWAKQLPATDFAELLNYETPTFYRVAGWLMEDDNAIFAFHVLDETTGNFSVFVMRAGLAGNTLWTHYITPGMEVPFMTNPNEVDWQSANNNRVYYHSDSLGRTGVFNPATQKVRTFDSLSTINAQVRYRPFLFDDGALGVTRLHTQDDPSGATKLTQYYTFFDGFFNAYSQGDWVSYDFPDDPVSPAILSDFISSQFENRVSAMIADSSTKMRTGGFVSNKAVADGGVLFNTTAVDIGLQDSDHSLTDAVINIVVSSHAVLEPIDAGVTSKPLANAAFPLSELTEEDIHHTGGLNAFGDWAGTFFGYPWFTYNLRQGVDLVDWDDSLRTLPYGFQETSSQIETFPFFEQAIAAE